MKIWTVANQKGGVGKTTTAVGLGGLLAEWGFRVLLVDIDPHGSLTSYFGYDPDRLESGTYALFEAAADQRSLDPATLIRSTGTEGLDLLPASVALATLDRQAGRQAGMGLVLKRGLEQLEPYYDHVLIDCPPMLGMLLVNALAVCDRLIIPVQTEFLSLKGLERMLHTLEMIHKARPSPLPYIIVPTMFDRRTRASLDTLRLLQERYAARLWDQVIPIDTRFRDASRAGMPPAVYDPRARGVVAYGRLLEFLQAEVEMTLPAEAAG